MLKERFQDPCSVAQMRIAGKIQFFPSQNFFINIAEFYDYEHCMRIRKTYLKTQCSYDLLFCFQSFEKNVFSKHKMYFTA